MYVNVCIYVQLHSIYYCFCSVLVFTQLNLRIFEKNYGTFIVCNLNFLYSSNNFSFQNFKIFYLKRDRTLSNQV